MQVYSNWLGLKDKYKNLVVGLGNFDGLHLGHQKLIQELVVRARKVGGTPAVFTFFPHPMVILRPEQAPPMLLSHDIKRKMLSDMGIKVLILVPFTLDFASMSPEEFISTVLHKGLGINSVFVGYNCTFGYMGRGTPELLKEYGQRLGFGVEVISPVAIDGQPISSTLIRGLLADGEVVEAKKYLGYCPFVIGKVIRGDRRGNSLLGFPTANLEVDSNLLVPANGVYSAKVKIDHDIFLGVANIGVVPTFHDESYARTIEVHLLDFSGDLYGQVIQVYLTRRLRREKKFHSPGELIEQIQRDINATRTDAAGQV